MNTTRKLKFEKYGLAENPIGLKVTWTVQGRKYLADVVDVYHDEFRGVTILKTRHFNGKDAPDVSAAIVDVI